VKRRGKTGSAHINVPNFVAQGIQPPEAKSGKIHLEEIPTMT
jgi:hypothetical protein